MPLLEPGATALSRARNKKRGSHSGANSKILSRQKGRKRLYCWPGEGTQTPFLLPLHPAGELTRWGLSKKAVSESVGIKFTVSVRSKVKM